MLAINNYAPRKPRCRTILRRLLLLTMLTALGFNLSARSEEIDAKHSAFARRAQEKYVAAQKRFLAEPTNSLAVVEFARACFDRAEYATNDTERALIAVQGITVCRELISRNVNSAEGHYYLGMNLGQLARTKTLGALRIVDEMEREFKMARALNEHLDYAGPDRNLGLLYLDAPSIASIGSRSKARQHLLRAAALAPLYPENRLNLAEAYLKWGDYVGANRELTALKENLPRARAEFAGEDWAASWADWEARMKKIEAKVEGAGKAIVTPRH